MKSSTIVAALLNVLFPISLVETTLTEKVTQNYLWDGVLAYIAVDRQAIQDRLDEWHESMSTCDGPRLYLPTSPVFPDVLDESQHVVYIGTGYVNFYDFQDLQNECISIDGMEFAITIPLLTNHLDGDPMYSLSLKNFYERGRGDIPRPNIALPYVPVEEITRNQTSVVMKNSKEELRVSFVRNNESCKAVNPVVSHEFDEYLDKDLHFGAAEPNFSFCDRHPIDNQFCRTAKSISCKVHRSAPNICQTSWKTPSRVSCETPVQIDSITKGFRDMLLLGDGEIKVIASEAYFGNISLGLKFPCIE